MEAARRGSCVNWDRVEAMSAHFQEDDKHVLKYIQRGLNEVFTTDVLKAVLNKPGLGRKAVEGWGGSKWDEVLADEQVW